MESSSKRKWQIRAAVLAIFLLGAVAGAMALNVYKSKLESSSQNRRRGRFDQMTNQLNLSTEQKSNVDQIMRETRESYIELRRQNEPKYDEIRRLTDSRLEAVLTPEQWRQWRQMTEDMQQRRRRSPRDN